MKIPVKVYEHLIDVSSVDEYTHITTWEHGVRHQFMANNLPDGYEIVNKVLYKVTYV